MCGYIIECLHTAHGRWLLRATPNISPPRPPLQLLERPLYLLIWHILPRPVPRHELPHLRQCGGVLALDAGARLRDGLLGIALDAAARCVNAFQSLLAQPLTGLLRGVYTTTQ